MNILEEIPKSKSESMLSSLPSKSISSSKEVSQSFHSPTNYNVNNEPVTSVSDHFSMFDIRTLIIIFLLFLIILTYFGINVLKIFGEAIADEIEKRKLLSSFNF